MTEMKELYPKLPTTAHRGSRAGVSITKDQRDSSISRKGS